jgi:glycine cleavage system H lipoate-binding protein
MFPWVYEFHWTVGQVVFLGAFFAAVSAIGLTIVKATRRTLEDMQRGDSIVWHYEFQNLPPSARICRHELSGDEGHRICDHDFDCRDCSEHCRFLLEGTHKEYEPGSEGDILFGFVMPRDRLYHRGHAWAHREEDGTYTIGMDDLGMRLMGFPDSVDLPAPGTRMKTNGTGWYMRTHGLRFRVLSPIDGIAIEQGSAVEGWYIRVLPDSQGFSTGHLLRGNEVRPWLLRELERLQFALRPANAPASLADGGELIHDLSEHMPVAIWEKVCGEILLEML